MPHVWKCVHYWLFLSFYFWKFKYSDSHFCPIIFLMYNVLKNVNKYRTLPFNVNKKF